MIISRAQRLVARRIISRSIITAGIGRSRRAGRASFRGYILVRPAERRVALRIGHCLSIARRRSRHGVPWVSGGLACRPTRQKALAVAHAAIGWSM
jgi:hypothetical protein